MKFRACRYIIGTGLGGVGLPVAAFGGATASHSMARELLPGAVMLLLLAISLILAWRARQVRGALHRLQAQLETEHRVRMGAEQALHDCHAKLCTLIAAQNDVKQGERQRIGRDIHDDLGQNLLALKIDISLLRLSTADMHPLIHQKLIAMTNQIDLTIRSLRAVIDDLRPVALERGLRNAIEWQLQEFSRSTGIAHQLEAGQSDFQSVSSNDVDIMVFHILQESLSNIARHAQATEIWVTLCRNGDGLSITVRDNGIGMPSGKLQHGFGLPGIEERVRAVGGVFCIKSEAGRGTALTISIPLAALDGIAANQPDN